MRLRTSIRYVALPASAALLLLTGCGSGGSGNGPAATSTPDLADPLKMIQAAYTTTTSAKTARIAFTFGITGSGTPSSGGLTFNISEDFDNNALEESMDLLGQNDPVQARVIGRNVWVKPSKTSTPDPSVHLPPITKPWLHELLPKIDQDSSRPSSLFGGSGPDPTAFLKLLTGVSSSVTQIGTDVVRGQRSTHYRITLDAAKIAKLDGETGDCNSGDSASAAATPVDVWLDGQGRLTRMQISDKLTPPSESDVPSGDLPTDFPSALASEALGHLPAAPATSDFPAMTITLEVYDYGAHLHVSPPPAGQVQDVSKYVDPNKLVPSQSPCPTP